MTDYIEEVILITSDSKIYLEFFFHALLIELIKKNSVYIIESKKRINLGLLASRLRKEHRNVMREFEKIKYSRPINIYQFSAILKEIPHNASIIIPNFTYLFDEEGVNGDEKEEQFGVLSDQLINSLSNSFVFLGCQNTELKENVWMRSYLDMVMYKHYQIEELNDVTESFQQNFFLEMNEDE